MTAQPVTSLREALAVFQRLDAGPLAQETGIWLRHASAAGT